MVSARSRRNWKHFFCKRIKFSLVIKGNLAAIWALDPLTEWDGVQGNSKARGLYKREKPVCSLNTVLYSTVQSRMQHRVISYLIGHSLCSYVREYVLISFNRLP